MLRAKNCSVIQGLVLSYNNTVSISILHPMCRLLSRYDLLSYHPLTPTFNESHTLRMDVDFNVQQTRNKGMALFAARAFTTGDVIVSEPSLGSLPTMLSDTFDDESFFDPAHEYSGVPAIRRMVDGMTAHEHQLFAALYSRQQNIQSTVQNNVFSTFTTDHNGHELLTLRLYHIISRANNSCRPNSLYSHNPNTGHGDLRAIRNIANGEEITVEYQCHEKGSLRGVHERESDFRDHYGFRCDCPACRGRQRRRDNQWRIRASELSNGIITASKNVPNNDGVEADRAARLANHDEFVATLHNLEICDFKLSRAYKYRAEEHLRGYRLAQRDGEDHCPTCAKEGTPWNHLRLAREDLLAAGRIDTICYGSDHPECNEVQRMFAHVCHLMVVTKLPRQALQ